MTLRRATAPEDKARLQEQFIDATREVLLNKGVEAVTMRGIAKHVGYSATTLYLYFADKEALIQAVVDADRVKLASAFHQAAVVKDPVKRLFLLGRAYVDFALHFPNHYRMIFMVKDTKRKPPNISKEQHGIEHDAYNQLKLAVKEVMLAGKFKPEIQDAELAAQTIWAAMHGVCALHITLADNAYIDWRDIETRVKIMQTTIANGMLKDQDV